MKNNIYKKNLFADEVLLEGKFYIRCNLNNPYLMEAKERLDKKFAQYYSLSFKEIEEISLANLKQFWIEILESVKENIITYDDVLDIVDCLETYIYGRYEHKYPLSSEPIMIGLNALDFIKHGAIFTELEPQCLDNILSYLNTPTGKEKEANQYMENYIKQLEIR